MGTKDTDAPEFDPISDLLDREDAKRYRWLRDDADYNQRRTILNDTGHGIDASVDKAIRDKRNRPCARGEWNADE